MLFIWLIFLPIAVLSMPPNALKPSSKVFQPLRLTDLSLAAVAKDATLHSDIISSPYHYQLIFNHVLENPTTTKIAQFLDIFHDSEPLYHANNPQLDTAIDQFIIQEAMQSDPKYLELILKHYPMNSRELARKFFDHVLSKITKMSPRSDRLMSMHLWNSLVKTSNVLDFSLVWRYMFHEKKVNWVVILECMYNALEAKGTQIFGATPITPLLYDLLNKIGSNKDEANLARILAKLPMNAISDKPLLGLIVKAIEGDKLIFLEEAFRLFVQKNEAKDWRTRVNDYGFFLNVALYNENLDALMILTSNEELLTRARQNIYFIEELEHVNVFEAIFYGQNSPRIIYLLLHCPGFRDNMSTMVYQKAILKNREWPTFFTLIAEHRSILEQLSPFFLKSYFESALHRSDLITIFQFLRSDILFETVKELSEDVYLLFLKLWEEDKILEVYNQSSRAYRTHYALLSNPGALKWIPMRRLRKDMDVALKTRDDQLYFLLRKLTNGRLEHHTVILEDPIH